jgi:hypothetical protein
MLEKYGEQYIEAHTITHVKDNKENGATLFFIGGTTTTLNRAEADKFLANEASEKAEPTTDKP